MPRWDINKNAWIDSWDASSTFKIRLTLPLEQAFWEHSCSRNLLLFTFNLKVKKHDKNKSLKTFKLFPKMFHHYHINFHLHPGKLTWNLQITHLERKMIFQTSIIMVHVNLPGVYLTISSFVSFKGNPPNSRACQDARLQGELHQ